MADILQFKGYFAALHYSAEDEVFHGKLLDINDLVTFEGASVKELKKAFYKAVDDYLDTCSSLGKDPDKTFKGTFNVRISSPLHKDAANFAAINNVSLNEFVKNAIHFALVHKSQISSAMVSSLNIHANK